MTTRIIAVLLCTICLIPGSALSTAIWTGYINDKSSPGQRYGYIESISLNPDGTQSKLRLTCYPPQGFRLYIDEKSASHETHSHVSIQVDKLPAMRFALYRHEHRLFLSDQTVDFWDLIAQMIAGGSLKLTLGKAHSLQYRLNGFTKVFKDNCDWMPNADNYRVFIDKYR